MSTLTTTFGAKAARAAETGTAPRTRLRLAIQKSGRLSDKSRDLLDRAGLACEWRASRLDGRAADFPLDVMLVRDDDIPYYVAKGICDLGIVGANMLAECLGSPTGGQAVTVVRPLGFGRCRLAIALPQGQDEVGIGCLNGSRIATSYPVTLQAFLDANGLKADVITIGGSVEVAPAMGFADAVCDLVSTGGTLAAHGLRELVTVAETQAVLVRSKSDLGSDLEEALSRLTTRINGVLRAAQVKYIMMNAPRTAVDAIRAIIPGMEEPTVLPLGGGSSGRVAIHAVAPEPIFWETMERLKGAGASSILVVPIEKIIE